MRLKQTESANGHDVFCGVSAETLMVNRLFSEYFLLFMCFILPII